MAGRYAWMTADQLVAEIAAYREAIRSATLGGDVKAVGGEGRRLEVTAVNVQQAQVDLRDLVAELGRRPETLDRTSGRAIAVEIGSCSTRL